jgi:hypothetical protein
MQVVAFDASANVIATPRRTITGFRGRYQGFPLSIATMANGQLAVIDDDGDAPKLASCTVVVEKADADGASGMVSRFDCSTPSADVIARGPSGQIDLRVTDFHSTWIRRLDGGVQTGSFLLPSGITGFTTDSNAAIIVTTARSGGDAGVDVYSPTATDGAAPVRALTFATGGMAPSLPVVAPDGTLYVALFASGPNGHFSMSIAAIPPGGSSPTRTIGPLVDSQVTAVACDSAGELYVAAFSPATQRAKIDVYAPDASGSAIPLRSIVASSSGQDPFGYRISSIALGP